MSLSLQPEDFCRVVVSLKCPICKEKHALDQRWSREAARDTKDLGFGDPMTIYIEHAFKGLQRQVYEMHPLEHFEIDAHKIEVEVEASPEEEL